MTSIKSATTENIVRANVRTGNNAASAGINPDGTVNVLIQSVVSAFGPKNLGNYYMLRIAADTILPARFDCQNADSQIWLGTWEVRDMPGKEAKLWDAVNVAAPIAEPVKRSAVRTVPSATLTVAPEVPAFLSGLVIAGPANRVSSRLMTR